MLFALCTLVVGCSYKVRYSGVVIRPSDLKQIRVNESSRADIYRVLGSPTFLSLKDPQHRLHYASTKLKIAPDRSAKILETQVYTFELNDKDILVNIEQATQHRKIKREKDHEPKVFKKAPILQEFLASSAARFK